MVNWANWLYSAKMVVFGQSVCIRVKVIVFEQKRLYSGKEVVLGQSVFTRPKKVVFGQSG